MLYTMELTGKEIDRFLEHAAGIWFNTMKDPSDHLLQFRKDSPGRLINPYYNFSSAAGIEYTVNLRLPPGNRVTISGFTNGSSFSETESYQVAINSYRGNGGGGHLTAGSGIPHKELSKRITWSTDIDLRYYLMQHLADLDTLYPVRADNWHCEPVDWVKNASASDMSYFR